MLGKVWGVSDGAHRSLVSSDLEYPPRWTILQLSPYLLYTLEDVANVYLALVQIISQILDEALYLPLDLRTLKKNIEYGGIW